MVNIIIWFISCFALKQRPHYTGPAAVHYNHLNPTSRFPLEKEGNDDWTEPSGSAARYREVQNVLPFPISQLKSQRDRKVMRANAEVGTEISYLFYWALVGWLLLNM